MRQNSRCRKILNALRQELLNEIVKDSIEALHYCEIDVKMVKNV